MLIIKPSILRQYMRLLRLERKSIALIPTMGKLHAGHMKLINEAKARADITVVSIFVNPMLFNRIDDLVSYPRTLREDYENLKKHQVDFVFSPTSSEIYPLGTEKITYVEVPGISDMLEGVSRPGHFRGVSTIISKLFNLVQPNVACFGEKDFLQLVLIRKMVADLNYDIDIVGVPTVRAKDGLALSSRNCYLTRDQRKNGSLLSLVINLMAEMMLAKKLTIKEIINIAKLDLNNSGFQVDDLLIRDADTLLELTEFSHHAVILATAWLGKVRLIDNKVVDLT